jgi:hypothetical protein
MKEINIYKWFIIASVVSILILTVLEFPAPIGFEVRPQDHVSRYWLFLFLAILISEISSASFIFKKPKLGAQLGILAAILNILQIVADQLHLMQPEIAPFGYYLLENTVGVFSIFLGYLSWKVLKISQNHSSQYAKNS